MNKLFKQTFLWLILMLSLAQTPSFGRQIEETVPAPAGIATGPEQYTASPAMGARDIIDEIMGTVGLKPRFEVIKSGRVPNAAAVIMNGKRYILYNERFLAGVNNAVRTDWAGVSILAHEIGHHLNGHTLARGGSNPADELEADEFSGFVLRKMGAPLEEAMAAMNAMAEEEDSYTHPGRRTRLAAISTGWQNAEAQIMASAQPRNNERARQIQEPVTAQTTYPVTKPAQNRVQENIMGKLTFQDSPEENFFLTSALKLVRVDEDGAQVVGQLSKSNSERFPYILKSDYFQSLFVAKNGTVVNRNGQRVGVITNQS